MEAAWLNKSCASAALPSMPLQTELEGYELCACICVFICVGV